MIYKCKINYREIRMRKKSLSYDDRFSAQRCIRRGSNVLGKRVLMTVLAMLLLTAAVQLSSIDRRYPNQIILTWQNDPQTTMTVTWRSDLGVEYLTYGERIVQLAAAQAERDRDPDTPYQAMQDPAFQQLWLTGNWEDQGYASLDDAVFDMCYKLALSGQSVDEIVDRFQSSRLEVPYWGYYSDNRFWSSWRDSTVYFTDDSGLPVEQYASQQAETYTFREFGGWLHTAELTGLSPDTEYTVVVETGRYRSEPFTFITAPSEERPIRFITGGDSRTYRDDRRKVNVVAAAYDPEFVVFNGDLIERALNEQHWDEWFDDWHEQMITESGRRIPVIPTVGNHEIEGSYFLTKEEGPFYFNRFHLPGNEQYYVIEYGPNLALVQLDSDHSALVDGDQKQWLEQTLQHYSQTDRFIKVSYHVAAWPSVKTMEGDIPTRIREHWVPLFEQYGVDLVAECHEHSYKRTEAIFDGGIDPVRGVVYIGDGGWGAPLRRAKDPDSYWWLKESLTAHHFIGLELSACGMYMQVEPVIVGHEGEIDITPIYTVERKDR